MENTLDPEGEYADDCLESLQGTLNVLPHRRIQRGSDIVVLNMKYVVGRGKYPHYTDLKGVFALWQMNFLKRPEG